MSAAAEPPPDRAGTPDSRSPARLRFHLQGLVQGVGFRPFVHRLARDLALAGFVRNTPGGVWIEVEGPAVALDRFRDRLRTDRPAPSAIHHVEETVLAPSGHVGFRIESTASTGPTTALVLPDLAPCPECRRELFDPRNRRFRHPFANCTHCGPRYSILLGLPYDRARTTLQGFPLCAECTREFGDPSDRRFHAQPIACPRCGPRLAFHSGTGAPEARDDDALARAVAALRNGRIVALKGVGGFQLLVRADSDEAVQRLRLRKLREAKPLALMCDSVETARRWVSISPAEARLLESAAAPIVLLDRLPDPRFPLAPSIAPDHPCLGFMLPSSPLHHLLLADLALPVVATSGNPGDEPLCTDEVEARHRLREIADAFLVHDRPIARPVDDSLARVLLGTEQILRRARGYAPLPLPLPPLPATRDPGPRPAPDVLAVGAHLKAAIAVTRGDLCFLGPHLGDLESAATAAAFVRSCADLPRLLDARPAQVATDLHPDYFSTQHATELGLPAVGIPHHEAHAWSGVVDNDLPLPVLAFSWDGIGLGPDRTGWGGEGLELTARGCRRRIRLRPFPLPGGDTAARDGRRCALGLLHEAGLLSHPRAADWMAAAFPASQIASLRALLPHEALSPRTSSMGRLFDATAALLGLRHHSRYEGEAAAAVEWAAERQAAAASAPAADTGDLLPVRAWEDGWEIDWQPWAAALLENGADGEPQAGALRFHLALARAARTAAERVGLPRVLLTGGCFQNRFLTLRVVESLRAGGFSVYWHQRIPPNDGGLAAGQAAAARWRIGQGVPEAASPAPRR